MLTLPLVLVLALPAPISRFMSLLYNLPLFVTSVLVARSLSLKSLSDRPYLGLYFISLIVFMLWGSAANTIAKTYFFIAPVLSNTFTALSQFIMLSQDYTEARRKVRELAASTDFYHRMAHDLLTPLTIVSTNVQIAGRKPEEAPALLRDAQKEIMQMAEMINDALDKTAGTDKGGDE
jgi:signal transduction histidine kinase